MDGLIQHSETINKLLARYGVKFGIYKNGEFKEQLFPFDPIPRVIARNLPISKRACGSGWMP